MSLPTDSPPSRELAPGGDRAAVGLFDCNERGEWVHANERLGELLGLPPASLLGWGWSAALHPEDRSRLLREWNHALAMGVDLDIEARAVRRKGAHFWCLFRIAPARDPSGRLLGFHGAVIDADERHREVEALRHSEERYRRLVERSPDGIAVTVDNLVQFANPAMARHLGLGDPRELIGRPSSEFVHPDSIAAVMQRRALEEQGTVLPPQEIRIVRQDGSTLPVEYFSVLTDFGGQRARQLVVRDVSERQQSALALAGSQARLRALLRAVPDIIFLLDRRGRYVDHHAPEPTALVLPWDRIRGRTVHELLPDSQADELMRLESEARRTGEVQICHLRLPTRPEPRDYEIRVAAVDEDRWLAIARDVTEARRAATESARLARRMDDAQRLESLGILAGGIAHDFNNILTAVLGFADLALLDLPPSSPARESVQRILSGARSAAELTRQLLAYSGKGLSSLESVHLPSLVADMTHLLEVSAGRRSALRTDIALEVAPVEGDPAQLRQVVLNLVLNGAEAIDDASEGWIAVRIHERECAGAELSGLVLHDDLPGGRYVVLEVEDNGHGMNVETQARMFEPFFTTKFPGRGLGLASVLGIVRSHRGTLDVASSEGKGTLVRAFLPASRGRLASTPAPAASEEWQGSGLALVVDDDPALRQLAGAMLERLGFSVLVAGDGLAGLALVHEHARDLRLVLLDLTMPRLDGGRVLRQLQDRFPNLPVVLSSGYHQAEVLDSGRAPAGFAKKPYRFEELRAIVRAALER